MKHRRSASPRRPGRGPLSRVSPGRARRGTGGGEGLNVYNWSDYIADDTLANFEKETGIKVRYDNFDNNEILHAKLVAGKTGYDVVVPSSYWAKIQADGGLLRKLDRSQLPNWKNLDPDILATMEKLDPGNQYMVNWLWGFTTIGINVDKVGGTGQHADARERLGPRLQARVHGQAQVLRRELPRLGHRDHPIALHYLGKNPVQQQPCPTTPAAPLLKSIRPLRDAVLRQATSTTWPAADLRRARLVGRHQHRRNRDRRQDRQRHREALIPKTGGILFFDTMVIPVDAPHPATRTSSSTTSCAPRSPPA